MPLHEWFILLNCGCTKGVQAFEQKKCDNFLLFPVAYLGKVSLSFVKEKITQLFSSSPGTKTLLDCRMLCPAEQAGWGGCTSCVLCRGMLWDPVPWMQHTALSDESMANQIPQLAACPRTVELPWKHSLNYCLAGGYQRSCGWRSVLPCAFISPFLCGMSTNWSLIWQLQTKRKPRRPQQSFIH